MIHRLLCCSDTHGGRPPPLDESAATAWLHVGDVADGPSAVDDHGPLADPHRAVVARWYTNRPVPVFVVRGNHDVTDDLGAFATAADVTGRVRRLAERLWVAGVGWKGERYYELPLESDLRSACDDAERMARRLVMPSDRVVLLTHYPPRLPGMRSVDRDPPNGGLWYDCVRELAEALRPVAVVQGHVHQWAGTSQTVPLGGSDVVVFHPGAAGGTLLIDVTDGSAAIEWPA